MLHVIPSMDNLQFAYIPDRCTEDGTNILVHECTYICILKLMNGSSDKLKTDVNKFRKSFYKMISLEYYVAVDTPIDIYSMECKALAKKILENPTHPLHCYCDLLPHGERMNTPRPFCRTFRFHACFVPSAIKIFNHM